MPITTSDSMFKKGKKLVEEQAPKTETVVAPVLSGQWIMRASVLDLNHSETVAVRPDAETVNAFHRRAIALFRAKRDDFDNSAVVVVTSGE